jgi:general stress protein CsbA
MDTRQRLIDAQIERLRAAKSNEDQRLASQQAEAEAATQQREAAKQAAQEALASDIERSRAQQLARKEAERQRDEKEAAEREAIRQKEFSDFVAKEKQVQNAAWHLCLLDVLRRLTCSHLFLIIQIATSKKQASIQNKKDMAEQIVRVRVLNIVAGFVVVSDISLRINSSHIDCCGTCFGEQNEREEKKVVEKQERLAYAVELEQKKHAAAASLTDYAQRLAAEYTAAGRDPRPMLIQMKKQGIRL